MLPFFDSLTHPTLSGKWPGKDLDARFEHLVQEMQQANFVHALAVGLHGVEGYEHEEFVAHCKPHPSLIPIAGFDVHTADFRAEIDTIKSLGFAGIKIHPRISNMDYSEDRVADILQYCGEKELVVLYCTYAHTRLAKYPLKDPFYALVKYLRNCEKTKVILMHGGDVNLLRYAELVRFNPNLVLDLSMTIMKYAGSSLDNDLKFLFHSFDRRICVGTDHPEYSHQALRGRVEYLCSDLELDAQKLANIAYKNLDAVFGVNSEKP